MEPGEVDSLNYFCEKGDETADGWVARSNCVCDEKSIIFLGPHNSGVGIYQGRVDTWFLASGPEFLLAAMAGGS